jgi:hypothetical protein
MYSPFAAKHLHEPDTWLHVRQHSGDIDHSATKLLPVAWRRKAAGGRPKRVRNALVKAVWSEKPTRAAMSATDIDVSANN